MTMTCVHQSNGVFSEDQGRGDHQLAYQFINVGMNGGLSAHLTGTEAFTTERHRHLIGKGVSLDQLFGIVRREATNIGNL